MQEEITKKNETKEGTDNQKGGAQSENSTSQNVNSGEEVFMEGIGGANGDNEVKKKIQNYLAILIVALGALLGSIFVDVAQLVSKEGYSPKALKETNVFELDGKTWVAYQEPIVNLSILTVSEEEQKNCPTCKPAPEVTDLLKKVMPTLVIKEVDLASEEGQKLAQENKVKMIPSFIFSDKLTETDFYNSGETKTIFAEVANGYLLNLGAVGLPVGKYITVPEIKDGDPTLGNKDAKVKIFLFSDHQCPFCAKFFNEIVETVKKFGDKVVLVYKDMPLQFHPLAKSAALAGACANEQGKFWEFSADLYGAQKEWGELSDEEARKFFKERAGSLGLNSEQFGKCLDDNKYLEKVEEGLSEGREFSISGTPTTFVNDVFLGGVVDKEELEKVIQEQINKNEN